MDRRKFLGKAALAGIPVVLTGTTSAQALGTPASLNNGVMAMPKDGLLTLPLGDAVPASVRTLTQAISTLFARINTDPKLAKALVKDPAAVLKEYGLDKYINANDPLVETLKVAVDQELVDAVKGADYDSFIATLQTKGILKRLSKSKLRDYYFQAFSADQENFKKYFKQIFDANPNGVADAQARSQRINRIVDLMQGGMPQKSSTPQPSIYVEGSEYDVEYGVVGAVALAVVAVVAATYVIAAVNVGVGVNVVAIVSVSLKLAVFGDQDPEAFGEVTSVSGGDKIISERISHLQRASMAAKLSGRPDLALESLKRTVTEDLDAMVRAAERAKLIALPRMQRAQIMFELEKLCLESVGIQE